jgi:hypothetical protein
LGPCTSAAKLHKIFYNLAEMRAVRRGKGWQDDVSSGRTKREIRKAVWRKVPLVRDRRPACQRKDQFTMRILFLLLILAAPLADQARADDAATCTSRLAELARKAAEYKGEDRMRRLIEADLRRASKEQAEGDAEECMEALDHAAKLLAGDV